MHDTRRSVMERSDLKAFERNLYFYGKLLDAYNFELETAYHSAKRWLLNRLVLGHGVVCGLNVEPGDDPFSIVITPGLGIDKWGREIVVAERSRSYAIPKDVIDRATEARGKQPEGGGRQRDARRQESKQPPEHDRVCVRVELCYHECETDPAPVLAGDCQTADPCRPGKIREQYRVEFLDGCGHPGHDRCAFEHIVAGGRIDYDALAKWVTLEKPCADLPRDPCIRLAQVYLWPDEGHRYDPDNIDITVRPIVYSNDLLFDILLGWQEGESRGGGREQD